MSIRTAGAAASSAGPSSSGAAPWRALFLEHLGPMTPPLCAVSTVRRQRQRSSSAGDGDDGDNDDVDAAAPRVRNCVFRGMWADLPANPRNPLPRNPAGRYESDLPVFTTDARMAKAWEVRGGSSSGGGAATPPTTSAALAGPVEAVWWAAAAGTQWRVRGHLWLLGADDVEGAAGAAARRVLGGRMRRTGGTAGTARPASGVDDDDDDGWSWAREVLAHLGNLSPAMRGSFRNPPPGQPRPTPRAPGEGLGAPVTDADLTSGGGTGTAAAAEARANFRVCVLVPEQVDQTDLSRGDDARRWVYTYVGEQQQAEAEARDTPAAATGGVHREYSYSNGWEKVEVWP